MPDITNHLKGREKRLDVSQFFGESAYITLISLKKSDKKRIQLLSMSSALVTITKKMMDDGGLENIDHAKIGKMYLDLTEDEKEKAARVSNEIETIIINHGIHHTNHNLLDGEGKPYPLTEDFWENFPEACQFVIGESQKFNEEGIPVGESR